MSVPNQETIGPVDAPQTAAEAVALRASSAGEDSGLSHCSALIVDSAPSRFQLLRQNLRELGLTKIYFAPGEVEANELFVTINPDLLILNKDGLSHEELESIAGTVVPRPAPKRPPVLFVSSDPNLAENPDALANLFEGCVVDFLGSGYGAAQLQFRVQNLLRIRDMVSRLQRQQDWLEQAVMARTQSLLRARREVLERLAYVTHVHDDGTGEHTRKVGYFAARTAQAMNLDPVFVDAIASAALLHDVGKIGVPDSILQKPGPLTPEEFEVVKQHPRIGAEILADCSEPILQMAREIALTHHEKFDGTGYPNRLSRNDIPLSGRIVAVCDVYDALTRDRVYRAAMSAEEAIQYINEGSGTSFDPVVVEAFTSIYASLENGAFLS